MYSFHKKIWIKKFRIELITIEDTDSLTFIIPSPIKQFIFDYSHSTFLECNSEYSKKNSENMEKNMEKLTKVAKQLKYLTKKLENMYKRYFLIAGTLLGKTVMTRNSKIEFFIFLLIKGWYRDCGIIPFTTDTDIGMWIEDYEDKILDEFIGNQNLRLLLSFGSPNESYELRFIDDFFQYDCFFFYKHNATHQFLPYFQENYVSKLDIFLNYKEYLNLIQFIFIDNMKPILICAHVKFLDINFYCHVILFDI